MYDLAGNLWVHHVMQLHSGKWIHLWGARGIWLEKPDAVLYIEWLQAFIKSKNLQSLPLCRLTTCEYYHPIKYIENLLWMYV